MGKLTDDRSLFVNRTMTGGGGDDSEIVKRTIWYAKFHNKLPKYKKRKFRQQFTIIYPVDNNLSQVFRF